MSARPAPDRRPLSETRVRRLMLWVGLWLARLAAALPYLGAAHAPAVARRLSFLEYALAVLLFGDAMRSAPPVLGARRHHLHLVRRHAIWRRRSIRRCAHNALLARVRAHGRNLRKRIDAIAALMGSAERAKRTILRRLDAAGARLRALYAPTRDLFIAAPDVMRAAARDDSS